MNDPVNHPAHYTTGKIEVIEFIEDQKLNYHLGNALKYICRCEHKGAQIQDLRKSVWYLNRAQHHVKRRIAELKAEKP